MRRLICLIVVLIAIGAFSLYRRASRDVAHVDDSVVRLAELPASTPERTATAVTQRIDLASRGLPPMEPLPNAATSTEAGKTATSLATNVADDLERKSSRDTSDHELSADDIIRTMQESYATLQSYTDRGRKTRTWHELGKTYLDVPFRTFFKRPVFYRFEWQGEVDPFRESYWSNASGAYLQKQPGAAFRFQSLELVLKHTPFMGKLLVPLLLRASPSVPFLKQGVRLADDTADGVPCYRVSGVATHTGLPCDMWIGKPDFLLRRVDTLTPYAYSVSAQPVYKAGSETVRIDFLDVIADVSLPDELFAPRAND